jgi:peptidyl-prolyl cis-trans isomerase SurA
MHQNKENSKFFNVETMKIKSGILFFFLLFTSLLSVAQEKVVDEVVAVVGKYAILWSDVENQYNQFRQQGAKGDAQSLRCQVFEDLLFQKLLLNQAEIDSVVISDEQVESELDRRLRYYISQFGTQEKLEEFYDKTIVEFKEELREPLRQEMLGMEVQQKITSGIKVTPTEVRNFFNIIPKDSIPVIPMEYEIAQLVKQPPVSPEETLAAREKITDLRTKIISGEKNFATMARLYSEDPGSAKKGGELDFFGRGVMAPEFEAAAFGLKKKGDVSDVIKTQFGFHIIQLIERRGEYVNARHILIIPKVSPLDLEKAEKQLDSISDLIAKDSIKFDKAVVRFSDDPGKINGGMIMNPSSGNVRFSADELDPKVFFIVDKLQVGETSVSVPFYTEDGTQAYRLLNLKYRSTPHKANLDNDYNTIQGWSLDKKRKEALTAWIGEKSKNAYIRINKRFDFCKLSGNWTVVE